ncbi:MAG: thioredoxin family protein [Verrucomicrobia bacterium]|nr:thioredoxin family protein [Verrucomicrobiota bacterium]
MKRLLLLCALFLSGLACAQAAEAVWLTNYESAARQAAAEKKMLVLDFTGSDWCSWCMRLDQEVFSQAEFLAYAKDHLVLVKLDFPRQKPQTEAEKQQNERLSGKYKIEGFPTIVVLNPKGEKVGELGYEEGGPKTWLASLEKITRPAAK